LAEGLRGLSDGVGGLIADGLGAIEAEELAGCAGGFDYAVGDEGAEFVGV
jgi:hypothetical protein